ncbi:MAG: UPF0182 family protein [Gemmatimonadota bacterium]
MRDATVDSIRSTLRGGRLLLALGALLLLLLLLGRLATGLYVEVLWQASQGYAAVFWKRALWAWGARIVAGLVVGLLIFVNLRRVAATLGGIHIKRRFGNLEISEKLPQGYVLAGILGASALLALWFGAAVPRSVGTQLLLLVNGEAWGLTDPILGRDVSFYVFWLPLLASAVTLALVVTFLVFTLVTAGYAATGALRWSGTHVVTHGGSRLHMGGLLTFFLLLLAVRMWLGRYLLMLDGTSSVQGIVGFTDVQARLPALQTVAIITVLAAGGTAWGAWKNRTGFVLGSWVGALGGALLIGQMYPALVQRVRVQPNELERETPYIDYNLEFTRRGFGLDAMVRRPFLYRRDEPVDWPRAAEQFAGLPVWGRGPLLTTFREIEARFPYYEFTDVALDRYDTPRGLRMMAVSAREVDPAGIQDPNWQNLHIRERYIEGMGAVASLASERTPEGRPPMLLAGIPPVVTDRDEAPPEFSLDRPQVFFGLSPQPYAMVSPGPDAFLGPDGTPGEAGVDFPPGIPLSSLMRTAAFAWRFRDPNLVFTSNIGRDSRFVFRRQVLERIRSIAPFLRFPEAPYPVLAGGRMVWMVDAFTGTRAFPLSTPHEIRFLRSVSYIRNSVKITVDAVTGAVTFYRVPISDPLADAYAAAFPGLFKPMEEMPGELRAHVRYPTQLLNLQARVLLQYHQETAPAFHGQQDVWASPNELAQGTNPVRYNPEYGIYRLQGEEEARFQLTTVFVPAGRQNLTAILVGRTDGAGVPDLVLLDVSVEDQVPGPRQIEALVEQDPVISQQFSLWRTGGSEVWTGHLHLVPAGSRLLYMEPVFLAAEADAIPELRRFVVSDGRRVAMTESLAEAVAMLAGRDVVAETGGGTPQEGASAGAAPGGWPRSALDLLERAETRLKEGDWAGFGRALSELRALLEKLAGPGR